MNRESSSLSPPTKQGWFPTLREWLSGRASPCQGESRGFDPRLPLQFVWIERQANNASLWASTEQTQPA
jgi:hypothetical protein